MFETLYIAWTLFYPILLLFVVAYGGITLLLLAWNKESPPETVETVKDKRIAHLKRSRTHLLKKEL